MEHLFSRGRYNSQTDGVSSWLCSNGYSRFGELQGDHDATIGIISHELGHALASLPIYTAIIVQMME